MRKRKIIAKNKNSSKQVYQVAFLGFFITLICLILLEYLGYELNIQSKVKQLTETVGLISFICLIIFIISDLFRETVPSFKLEKMNFKARILAQQIRNKINDKALIYTLKLANETLYGYEMPAVRVFVNANLDEGFIAIENMGNKLSQLDNADMISSLSGLLTNGRLRKFSFISGELSRDGNYYLYYFEDSTTPQRLIVKNNNLKPFISQDNNVLKLAKNLSWRVDTSTPHLSIIGRTRAGKSFMVGEYLIPLMKKQNWKVEFFSVKNDLYVDKYDGQFLPIKIIERLEYWSKIMEQRNAEIKKAGKSKYTEMPDMPNVGLVIDEIGNLNGSLALDRKLKTRWESVIGKLTATGASAGIHIIAMSQYGTKEGFLPSTARANVSDAVIILGLAADNATDRQYMLPGFELPHRSYGTGQGIARIVSAGRKWETPHYYATPLFIKKDS